MNDVKSSWHGRYLGLAKHISQWSKDPSTKVGAVTVCRRNRVSSLGFNGFPVGVSDKQNRYDCRETKYSYVVHAEANAILNAQGRSLEGHTLYTTLSPCRDCAKLVIQSGIRNVIYETLREDEVTSTMFKEAGIRMGTASEFENGG